MTTFGKAANYWQLDEDGRVQCVLCPRRCRLREGQRGFCFVRSRRGNQMWLDTYGRSTGFAVDPIEKKPLNHFLPGTQVLSFGTAGCNLSCKFCQNWRISRSREVADLAIAAQPGEIANYAHRRGCDSVAFTYNDPVIFAEYAIDTAWAAREIGLKTVAVTAGYMCPQPQQDFFAAMDATNIDLKSFREEFYWRLTGAHLTDVLNTLAYVRHEADTWLEITTLLIPGKNDSANEISRLSAWIYRELGPNVPLHFSAFFPDSKMRDVPPTPAETLTTAREIAVDNGLNFVYTGNVHDRAGDTTYCPNCHTELIRRDWFRILENRIAAGNKCPDCSAVIPGVGLLTSA